MIITLVITSLATLWAWELSRHIITLPAILAPVAVFGMAYGILMIPYPRIVMAMSVAGGVALLHRILSPGRVSPLPWPDIRAILKPPKRYGRVHPGAMGRPPESMIGHRVPRL